MLRIFLVIMSHKFLLLYSEILSIIHLNVNMRDCRNYFFLAAIKSYCLVIFDVFGRYYVVFFLQFPVFSFPLLDQMGLSGLLVFRLSGVFWVLFVCMGLFDLLFLVAFQDRSFPLMSLSPFCLSLPGRGGGGQYSSL